MADDGINYRLLVERALGLPDAVSSPNRRRLSGELLRSISITQVDRLWQMSGDRASEHRQMLEDYTLNVIDHVVRRCELGDLDEIFVDFGFPPGLIGDISAKCGPAAAKLWPDETGTIVASLLDRIAKEVARSARLLRTPRV
jgi:hypothetical protein